MKEALEKNNLHLIILSDDNHIINNCNKNIISVILNESQRNYFKIICVNDGFDIIRLFFNNENNGFIKLLITDENMDYMNGSEAIRIIRRIENMRNIKRVNIISLSCHEDNAFREKILQAGADFILTKPLTKQSTQSLLEYNNRLF